MTRTEFLEQLKGALGNDLPPQAVQEQMDFYSQYINDELANGKSEEEIMDTLGDPWILARNIVDAPGAATQTASRSTTSGDEYDYSEGAQDRGYSSQQSGPTFRQIPWWKVLLVILVAIMVIVGIISLITGVISFLAPVLIPILIIVLILRLINGRN